MIRSRLLFLALLLSPFASMAPAHAHGSHGGGSELEAGEFDFTPLLTVEGHAGFDDNLEIPEKHLEKTAYYYQDPKQIRHQS